MSGKNEGDAKQALKDKGFDVDTNDVDGPGDKGTVLSTDPPAGTQVQPGSKVTLQVSKGNQDNQLPNVVGQTLATPGRRSSSRRATNQPRGARARTIPTAAGRRPEAHRERHHPPTRRSR